MVNPYLKTQIETASKEQLLIMLYDGAIKFLNQAKLALENKEYEESHRLLLKAQDIIYEFQATLDMDLGGELAQNLFNLYSYYIKRLVYANLKKDKEPIEEVLRHLKGLRDTWKQAILKNKHEESENVCEES